MIFSFKSLLLSYFFVLSSVNPMFEPIEDFISYILCLAFYLSPIFMFQFIFTFKFLLSMVLYYKCLSSIFSNHSWNFSFNSFSEYFKWIFILIVFLTFMLILHVYRSCRNRENWNHKTYARLLCSGFCSCPMTLSYRHFFQLTLILGLSFFV